MLPVFWEAISPLKVLSALRNAVLIFCAPLQQHTVIRRDLKEWLATALYVNDFAIPIGLIVARSLLPLESVCLGIPGSEIITIWPYSHVLEEFPAFAGQNLRAFGIA
jgi:hypothetical protein